MALTDKTDILFIPANRRYSRRLTGLFADGVWELPRRTLAYFMQISAYAELSSAELRKGGGSARLARRLAELCT